ncbi:hypothetical protein [Salaquimonas pukyongi]|uniref:hypothetical protein n=1 Tax=Salaquimonas pukyongi TaxID=2712698 RepID=UPI00096B9B11|nr:hypothetical protein [Salaquimonas pukyongi]
MKLPRLTISAFVLSATVMSSAAFAQSQPGNLVVLPGAKSCVVLGEQVFNCHYQRIFPKIIPPTFPPPTHRNPFSEIGNEGGGDRGGERGGGGGGGQGSNGARP